MADTASADPRAPLSRVEFVSLMAMLTAMVAFTVDAMLPAIPDIAGELSPSDPNRAQLVIATFLLGLGLGTFFTGPLSDAFGRKPVALAGSVVFILASAACALTNSIEGLLIARLVQGMGASGPRVVGMAIVRDLFKGRQMAQILSYVIFVFTLTPIVAPSMGWVIAWAFGWRAIFLCFAVFAMIVTAWLTIRQPETLLPENRRPFRLAKLVEGTRIILTNRQVVIALFVQMLIYSALFCTLLSSQQIFEFVFDRKDQFPLWFALMGVLAGGGNLVNAWIVMRVGMRRVVAAALVAQGVFTLIFLLAQLSGAVQGNLLFAFAFAWFTSIFFLAGFGIGNMNALALEPMGKMAGLAASIFASFATIGSIVISVPIGQAFNGTMIPMTIGVLVIVVVAYLLIRHLQDTDPA